MVGVGAQNEEKTLCHQIHENKRKKQTRFYKEFIKSNVTLFTPANPRLSNIFCQKKSMYMCMYVVNVCGRIIERGLQNNKIISQSQGS